MAHFAQLDENNVVMQVIVVHNNELVESKQATVNEDDSVSVAVVESEQRGIEFCQSLYGAETRWVQTSYNGSFRGKYAGVGDTYVDGAFVGPVVETPVGEPVVSPLTTSDVQPLTSTDIPALSSNDVEALTTADLPSITTSDISSLG